MEIPRGEMSDRIWYVFINIFHRQVRAPKNHCSGRPATNQRDQYWSSLSALIQLFSTDQRDQYWSSLSALIQPLSTDSDDHRWQAESALIGWIITDLADQRLSGKLVIINAIRSCESAATNLKFRYWIAFSRTSWSINTFRRVILLAKYFSCLGYVLKKYTVF